jgi:hypothetical protein
MEDNTLPPRPIRDVANESASRAVPIDITEQPDFEAWCAVADDLTDDIERAIRAEVDA